MADDDWDSENFEVPTLVQPVKQHWEDEEDMLLAEQKQKEKIAAQPSAQQLELNRKKAEEEDVALANHLKFSAQANETGEQRKQREKQQMEEADIMLVGELVSKTNLELQTPSTPSTKSSGLGGIPVKTKQDHSNFAILCAKKIADSTPLNVSTYYKTLTEKIKENVTSETLDEVLALLTKLRDDRKKTEAAKSKTAKVSKKQLEQQKQKHNDTFGGVDTDDKYEHLYDMEDDFM